MIDLTSTQLRQAADLKDQIANLNQQLAALFGGSVTAPTAPSAQPVTRKKGGMSAAGKARIAAAQKRRWANVHAAKAMVAVVAKKAAKAVGTVKPAPKKRKISPEGMARIIAGTKARWAKVRAAKAAKNK